MEHTPRQHPKFVRWALLVGIVVILNIFFSVVLALAYPAPQYDAFCPQIPITPTSATTCDAQGGVWTDNGQPKPVPTVNGATVPSAYCDTSTKCQKPYQAALDQHALHAFIVMVSLGVVALLLGLISIGSSIVSSGLSYGGVVALVIGSTEYWGSAGNWIRLAIATAGLLVLLYIGWKRFRD